VKRNFSLGWVLIIFAAGFAGGVVFSAWKLEGSPATAPKMAEQQDNSRNELASRIAGLEKMNAAKPNDPEVLSQLGNDYFDLGDHKKAIEYYSKALTVKPDNPDIITDMGISYRKLGNPQEAVKQFKRALETNPDHQQALFNLGLVLRDDLKDNAAALEAWEKYLKVAGDAPFAVMVKPWVKQLKDQAGAAEKKE
jgi:tetratricopeptide (TPR) repeat protein